MKKIVIVLVLISICIIASIFAYAKFQTDNTYFETDKELKDSIIGNKIVNPDRIVYKDNDNYYEFISGTDSYSKIKALLSNSIENYIENGDTLTDEQIDNIHNSSSFIEFDYETVSKNYIIQLEENENQAVIKLANSGGNVVCKNIKNLRKIKNTLKSLSENEKVYNLNYKEEISRNKLDTFDYKYEQLFKEINYKIYQIKISSFDEYKLFKEICKIAIDTEITEETFLDNDIILTVSLVPKIEPKVSIGNIKYKYDKIENAQYGYTVHLLIVSNFVNTDCIYNTDYTDIENNIWSDNIDEKHNEQAENLETNIFVTDFDSFINNYNNLTGSVTKEQAKEVAKNGFKEAERICGGYEESSETVREEQIVPNNFFTRKTNEPDENYGTKIDVYAFSREDEIGNGVKIYVDKKSGKIVGGGAFGD